MKTQLNLLKFVIVLLIFLIVPKINISQTIYQITKVSNTSFNATQRDTLIYIFVERDYLIKQDSLHKQEIKELNYKLDAQDIAMMESESIASGYKTNFDRCNNNNKILQANLDKAIKKYKVVTRLGGLGIIIVGIIAIVK